MSIDKKSVVPAPFKTNFLRWERGAVVPITRPCVELAALKIAAKREAKAIENLRETADNSRKFAQRARREGSVAAAELIEDRVHELETAVASRQARLRSMLGEAATTSISELAAFRPTCACCGHPDLVEAYKVENRWVGRECHRHYPVQHCRPPKVAAVEDETCLLGIDRSHAGLFEIELQEKKP